MAQIVEYANYVIYFSNEADYNFAVALTGFNTVQMSPADAASLFGFVDGVNFNTGGPLNPDKGMYGMAPYGIPTTPPGVEVSYPSPSGIFLTWDVDFVIVPGQAGSPASIFPAGPDLKLVWSATIIKQSATIDPGSTTTAVLPLRRWITGFEWIPTAEGGTAPGTTGFSRDSSRTLDGVGFGLRNNSNTSYTRSLNQYRTPDNAHTSWERFYCRVRTFGVSHVDIWKSEGSPSSNCGIRIWIETDGSINVYNVSSANVQTLLANTGVVFTFDEWIKIDCVVEYNALLVGGSGRFRLYVNGVILVDAVVLAAAGGLGTTNSTHNQTILGTVQATAANLFEIDFDDWHNAETPLDGDGNIDLTSPDFIVGTHIRRHWVNSGTVTNWTGQLQSVNQMMQPVNVPSTSWLTSSTSGAAIVGLTDVDDQSDPVGLVICACAALINSYTFKASGGTTAGALGYSLAGAAFVDTATVETVTPRYNTALWPGTTDSIVAPTITPFSIRYTKPADTIQTTVHAVSVEVQYVGIWGPEDTDGSTTIPKVLITHNSWFPQIAQAFVGPTAGPALVAVKSGTYVGNGTTNSIVLPLPPCMVWIRPVGVANGGVKWFAAQLAGNLSSQGAIRPDLLTRLDYDVDTGITTFTVVGTAAQCNQNAITYQYIAIMDPAFSFNLCGAYMHATALTTFTNTLIDSGFVPVAGFFAPNASSNDTTDRLIYKGPGHTGNTANIVDGTALTNAGAFGTGTWTSRTDAQNSGNNQRVYSLFRTTDECANTMFQIFSYTGNGASPRVINCTPISQRMGCFIYVQPHNGIGIVKDPSDVTTSSRQITGGAATATGITAVGIDTITVSSSLNANGIVYDVFIILGGLTFINGTFFPTPCLPPEIIPPPLPPEGINIMGEGGLILSGSAARTILYDVSGIYTIIPGKRNDTLYDRLSGQPSVDVAIPNPYFKTGYIGG